MRCFLLMGCREHEVIETNKVAGDVWLAREIKTKALSFVGDLVFLGYGELMGVLDSTLIEIRSYCRGREYGTIW
jgi:hypothetical protein